MRGAMLCSPEMQFCVSFHLCHPQILVYFNMVNSLSIRTTHCSDLLANLLGDPCPISATEDRCRVP